MLVLLFVCYPLVPFHAWGLQLWLYNWSRVHNPVLCFVLLNFSYSYRMLAVLRTYAVRLFD
jgi:hypothetical protein